MIIVSNYYRIYDILLFIDNAYKRRSVSNDSEIHLVNVKKENSSTMIRITNNWDDFLQAYASANSGDGSGSSNNKERWSVEKRKDHNENLNQHSKSSHVRFNSLVDVNRKFKDHKKLKFKNGKIAGNDYSNLRNVLGKIDTNAQFGNNSGDIADAKFGKTQPIYTHPIENLRDSSLGTGVMNHSCGNLQGRESFENKANLNLLESINSIEDKNNEMPPINSMLHANRICK